MGTRTTSASERGYDWNWQKLRERVLTRDCGICQPCKRAGRTSLANICDHIIPKFEGGQDVDENAEAICRDCHKVKTAAESARARLSGSAIVGPAR